MDWGLDGLEVDEDAFGGGPSLDGELGSFNSQALFGQGPKAAVAPQFGQAPCFTEGLNATSGLGAPSCDATLGPLQPAPETAPEWIKRQVDAPPLFGSSFAAKLDGLAAFAKGPAAPGRETGRASRSRSPSRTGGGGVGILGGQSLEEGQWHTLQLDLPAASSATGSTAPGASQVGAGCQGEALPATQRHFGVGDAPRRTEYKPAEEEEGRPPSAPAPAPARPALNALNAGLRHGWGSAAP
ncbi:unnamed protein product, partial [Polarella glacialis]